MEKIVKKCSILFAVMCLAAFSAISQNVPIDKRLEKGHDIEYLNRLQTNSPVTLEILNYELDHAWFIAEGDILQKAESIEFLYYKNPETGRKTPVKVEKIDINNMNIAEFYFERGLNNNTFYKIGNTNTIIGFYSLREVADMFNKEKGRNHE